MKTLRVILLVSLVLITKNPAFSADWFTVRIGNTTWEAIRGIEPHPICGPSSRGPRGAIEFATEHNLRYRANDVVENGIVVETTIEVFSNCTADQQKRIQDGNFWESSCFQDSTHGPYYRTIERCESFVREIDLDPENLNRYE